MFKRLFIFILAALVSAACQKSATEREVTVTFTISGVQSGAMTKALADDVAGVLASTQPTGPFTLNATSKTNPLRKYTITPGVPLTMAVDSYSISGSGFAGEIAEITNGKLCTEPAWRVSSDVVVEDGGELSVGATYPCIAVVIDKAATQKIVFANGANDVIPSGYGGNDDYGVVYAVPTGGAWATSKPLYVRVYPLDTVNYEVKEYKLCSTAASGMVLVKNGYWYMFSPGAVATTEGSIGVVFPSWGAGD